MNAEAQAQFDLVELMLAKIKLQREYKKRKIGVDTFILKNFSDAQLEEIAMFVRSYRPTVQE